MEETFPLRVLREIWQLVRLLTVGVAWGAPLLPVALVYGDTVAYDRLGSWIHPVALELLMLAPVMALVGIALLTVLVSSGHRLDTASAVAVLCTLVLPAGLWLFPVNLLAVPLATPVGVVVTVRVLWRRNRWISLTWVLLWVLAAGLTTLAGRNMEPTLAVGLVLAGFVQVLIMTSLAGALLGFLLRGTLWGLRVKPEMSPSR